MGLDAAGRVGCRHVPALVESMAYLGDCCGLLAGCCRSCTVTADTSPCTPPPQVLSTRARKDVAIGDIKVQVCVFPFDCLYINGRPLLSEPLTERRKALYDALEEREGELMFATYKTSRDTEELAVRGCCRGV